MRIRPAWFGLVLVPLAFIIGVLLPARPPAAQAAAVSAVAGEPGSESVSEPMTLPLDPAWTPAPRPDGRPAGLSARVMCRKVCTFRVLRRRGVVISRTPTACRVDCPGQASRSCSISECR